MLFYEKGIHNKLFLETIEKAYKKGDLSNSSDHLGIQHALLYENYINSTDQIRNYLEQQKALHRLNPNDPRPGYPSEEQKPFFLDYIRQGETFFNESDLEHIIPAYPFLDDVKLTSKIIQQIESGKLEVKTRVLQFKDAWREWCEKRGGRLLWLFDSSHKQGIPITELLQQLGLYHFGEHYKEDIFFHLTFERIECYKPTWIDACLAFFFDVASDTKEHGWTRCLKTGKRVHKESVHPDGASFVLLDVRILRLEQDINFSKPHSDFWDYHRKRILKTREGQVHGRKKT